MTEQPTPGALLRGARERTHLSVRRAAAAAGVSEGLWRQVEKGQRNVGGGVAVPVTNRPATLRRMAETVGLPPSVLLLAAGHEVSAGDEPVSYEPVPFDVRQIVSRVDQLSTEQRDRWLRLARVIAETLAAEDDRPMHEQSLGTSPAGDGAPTVTTHLARANDGDHVKLGGGPDAQVPTEAEQQRLDTQSDESIRRVVERRLAE